MMNRAFSAVAVSVDGSITGRAGASIAGGGSYQDCSRVTDLHDEVVR